MKLKRRLRGVMETMIKCALNILENLKNDNIVDRTSTRLELCSFMRRKRDKASTTKNLKR